MRIWTKINGVKQPVNLKSQETNLNDIVERLSISAFIPMQELELEIDGKFISYKEFCKSKNFKLEEEMIISMRNKNQVNSDPSDHGTQYISENEHLNLPNKYTVLLLKQINRSILTHHSIKSLNLVLVSETIDDKFVERGLQNLCYRLKYTPITDTNSSGFPTLSCIITFIHNFANISLVFRPDRNWTKFRSFVLTDITMLNKFSPDNEISEMFDCLNNILNPIFSNLEILISSFSNGVVSDTLNELAPRLMIRVLKYLNIKTIIKTAKVSRSMKEIVSSQELWKHLLKRDFDIENVSISWKTDYIKNYKKKKSYDRQNIFDQTNPQAVYIPVPTRREFVYPPDVTNFPEIIGGPRDMYPGGMPTNRVKNFRRATDPWGDPQGLDRFIGFSNDRRNWG